MAFVSALKIQYQWNCSISTVNSQHTMDHMEFPLTLSNLDLAAQHALSRCHFTTTPLPFHSPFLTTSLYFLNSLHLTFLVQPSAFSLFFHSACVCCGPYCGLFWFCLVYYNQCASLKLLMSYLGKL